MRARTLRRLLNLWPPFLASGIRVHALAEDWSEARVTLKLRPWNRNYMGTQFGGNLFAMTDPFWMLLALHRLGSDYIVWDRAATIQFEAPGRSHVHAHFRLDEATVQALRREAADGHKVLRWFEVDVTDEHGEVVARVHKQLYVRRKRHARPATQAAD